MIESSDKGPSTVVIFLVIALFLVSIPDFTIGKDGSTVSIDDYSLFSDETIIISIYISHVIDLASAEVNLSFNRSVVNILSVFDGDFDLTLCVIDNESGWARIGGVQLMSGWLNGEIILANISLNAIGEPGTTSFLNFTNLLLQDKTGTILSTVANNGTYRITDTVSPVITNVTVYPEAQERGGFVNITCIVADNVAVDEVWINMTYPDNSYHNFSMIKNSYYLNQTYDMSGSYFYVIWAADTSGNTNKSSKEMFSIFTPYYDLFISISPQQGGIVTLDPPGRKYEEGTQITLTANSANGYQFSYWGGDATGINLSIQITMDSDKSIIAYFQEITSHYNIFPSVIPFGGGSITLNPSGGMYDEGTMVTTTATANPSYEFGHWSGDISGNNASVHITMDQDKNIIAHFKEIIEQYTLTTSCIPAGGGSISLSPPGGLYDKGTIVTITALPNVGYSFDYWSGDATGASPITMVTMTRDKHVAAHFITLTENQPPVAHFTYSRDGRIVKFIDSSTDSDGNITSWYWDFGDHQYSAASSPTHQYDKGGDYTVKLAVTDDDGESDSFTQVVTVESGEADGGGIPGFEFIPLILSILGLLFITQRKRKYGYK